MMTTTTTTTRMMMMMMMMAVMSSTQVYRLTWDVTNDVAMAGEGPAATQPTRIQPQRPRKRRRRISFNSVFCCCFQTTGSVRSLLRRKSSLTVWIRGCKLAADMQGAEIEMQHIIRIGVAVFSVAVTHASHRGSSIRTPVAKPLVWASGRGQDSRTPC
eukprot:503335-Amphidinium_carterae.1